MGNTSRRLPGLARSGELLDAVIAQAAGDERTLELLDVARTRATIADLFSRLSDCRRLGDKLAAAGASFPVDALTAVNQEIMYCEAELARRGVWPYREQSAGARRATKTRMTNTANARHPRKRKLPTAAELHAELMKIQNEQRATFDEARTILQTNHRYATPQAINAKLRQVSRG